MRKFAILCTIVFLVAVHELAAQDHPLTEQQDQTTNLQVVELPSTTDTIVPAGPYISYLRRPDNQIIDNGRVVRLVEFTAFFSQAMNETAGDSNNYKLYEAGANGLIDTSTCSELTGDDVLVSIEVISFNADDNQVLIRANDGNPLPVGTYAFVGCESLTGMDNRILDGDRDGTVGGEDWTTFTVIDSITVLDISNYDRVEGTLTSINPGDAVEYPFVYIGITYSNNPLITLQLYFLMAGSNGVIDTTDCVSASENTTDDVYMPFVYSGNSLPRLNTIAYYLGSVPPQGNARLMICDYYLSQPYLDGDGDGVGGDPFTIDFFIERAPQVLNFTSNAGSFDSVFLSNMQDLIVTFSEPMNNPIGDTAIDDVTNPANYQLIDYGPDHTLQSDLCGSIAGDDIAIEIDGVTYDEATHKSVVSLGNSGNLPVGIYTAAVCSTVTDTAGIQLDGTGDNVAGDIHRVDFANDTMQLSNHFYVNTTDTKILGGCGLNHCTLAEAILAANAVNSHLQQTIHLQPDQIYELIEPYYSTYSSSIGLPTITNSITIEGNGATIQRSYAPGVAKFPLIQIHEYGNSDGITVIIRNTTLRNGYTERWGGGIENEAGTLIVENCIFEDNQAEDGGGAIQSSGELIVQRSQFIRNGYYDGGTSSQGGAIYSGNAALIQDSIFDSNIASGAGAISLRGRAYSNIHGNLFTDNYGGNGNHSILLFYGTKRIANNTFGTNNFPQRAPENLSDRSIYMEYADDVEIINNTFAESSSYAIESRNTVSVKLFGNIIFGEGLQCRDRKSPDQTLGHASTGYNVSNSESCLSSSLDNGDVLAEPQLGILSFNGGSTRTIPIGIDSPALDLIPEDDCRLLSDQRGMDRPIDGNGDGVAACDAGAFESLTLSSLPLSDLSLTLSEPDYQPTDAGLYTVHAVLRNDGPNAAENVMVLFGGVGASPARDTDIFGSDTGRWHVGNVLPGTEHVIDVVYRIDMGMKDQNLTLFAEVEQNLILDSDSTPNNANESEDDYDSIITTVVLCSVVPTIIEPNDTEGIMAAIYAANDEECNPGPDSFALSPNEIYLIHYYFYEENVDDIKEYTAFPPITSDVTIDGQGATLREDIPIPLTNPPIRGRTFLTLPDSVFTLHNLNLLNSGNQYIEGRTIKSDGSLFLYQIGIYNDIYSSTGLSQIFQRHGNLLIQDSYFRYLGATEALIKLNDVSMARIERSTFDWFASANDVPMILNQDSTLSIINSSFLRSYYQAIQSVGTGSLLIDQSTFWDNATALHIETPAVVRNTIFAQNEWTCSTSSDSSQFTSEGYNLIQQDALNNTPQAIAQCGFDHSEDIVVEDASLKYISAGANINNRPEIRPWVASPAVDAIPYEFCMVTVDQRLVQRPFNGACDIGAIELGLDENFGSATAPQLADLSDTTIVLSLPELPSNDLWLKLERLDTLNSIWLPIATYSSDTTTHVDIGLDCAHSYEYRVSYVNEVSTHIGQPSPAFVVSTLPCPTPVNHTFGLYKDGLWLFSTLDGELLNDTRFNWGPQEPGWQPVIGDWNGDGIDGIGLYKDGLWLLRSVDLSGNVIDTEFDFGDMLNGAVALAGDWDGDGVDTVGLFQNGVAYLRNSNFSGMVDLELSIGSAIAVPIVGDWNGNGVDTVGLYESTTFSLTAQNSQLPPMQTTFSFGPTDWQPLAGDWNDDGIDTIGIYNQGLWRMRNSNASGSVDIGFNYGNLEGGWQPLGNFDSSPAILNLLFAATVPTPRVPVIPGPSISTPTEAALDGYPPAYDEVPIEPTPRASVDPTLEITLTPEQTANALLIATAVPSFTPEPTQTEMVSQITPASSTPIGK